MLPRSLDCTASHLKVILLGQLQLPCLQQAIKVLLRNFIDIFHLTESNGRCHRSREPKPFKLFLGDFVARGLGCAALEGACIRSRFLLRGAYGSSTCFRRAETPRCRTGAWASLLPPKRASWMRTARENQPWDRQSPCWERILSLPQNDVGHLATPSDGMQPSMHPDKRGSLRTYGLQLGDFPEQIQCGLVTETSRRNIRSQTVLAQNRVAKHLAPLKSVQVVQEVQEVLTSTPPSNQQREK